MKRIILCGTPGFVIKFFEAFLTEEFEIIAVVTRRPKMRNGRRLDKSPVASWGLAHNLRVLEVLNINKDLELKALLPTADCVLVFAYGQIISEELLNLPRYGFFNIHPSKLPYLRGPSPLQYAIMAGDTEIGLTLMKMNACMDEGDIIGQLSIPLNPMHNIHVVLLQIGLLGSLWVKKALLEYLKNFQASPQNSALATYSYFIKKQDYLIQKEGGIAVINKIRALGFVFLEFKNLICKCYLAKLAEPNDKLVIHNISPIFLQIPGRKVLHIKHFLNGFRD